MSINFERGPREEARRDSPETVDRDISAALEVAARARTMPLPLTEKKPGREERVAKAKAAVEQATAPVELGRQPEQAKPPLLEQLEALRSQESGIMAVAAPGNEEERMDLARQVYGQLGRREVPFADVKYGDPQANRAVTELRYRTDDEKVIVLERWDGNTGEFLESQIVKCDEPVEYDRRGRVVLSQQAEQTLGTEYISNAPTGKNRKRHRIFETPSGKERLWVSERHYNRLMARGLKRQNDLAVSPSYRKAVMRFRTGLKYLGMPEDVTKGYQPITAWLSWEDTLPDGTQAMQNRVDEHRKRHKSEERGPRRKWRDGIFKWLRRA
jgi:hypothetical protein